MYHSSVHVNTFLSDLQDVTIDSMAVADRIRLGVDKVRQCVDHGKMRQRCVSATLSASN